MLEILKSCRRLGKYWPFKLKWLALPTAPSAGLHRNLQHFDSPPRAFFKMGSPSRGTSPQRFPLSSRCYPKILKQVHLDLSSLKKSFFLNGMRKYLTMFSGCNHYLHCIFFSWFYFFFAYKRFWKRLYTSKQFFKLYLSIYIFAAWFLIRVLDVTTTTKGLTQRPHLLQTHPGSWAIPSVRDTATVTAWLRLQIAVRSFTLRSSLWIHWWRYRHGHSVWNCWVEMSHGL